MDRVISVEYAIRDDDEKGNGHSPDRRGRDMSPDGRNYDRRRSPSPYQRDRGSPDYGHGSLPNSRSDRRGSPHYGRAESPTNDRRYHRLTLSVFTFYHLFGVFITNTNFIPNCIINYAAVRHRDVKDLDLDTVAFNFLYDHWRAWDAVVFTYVLLIRSLVVM